MGTSDRIQAFLSCTKQHAQFPQHHKHVVACEAPEASNVLPSDSFSSPPLRLPRTY